MKAILVINVPDNINFERLERAQISFYNTDSGRFIYRNARLKPIPQQIKSASEYGSDEVYIKHLINWKKEIDEILGGKE